jgi:putative transposase
MIETIFTDNRNIYGTRRIVIKLAKDGVVVSRRRVGKLMKLANLSCKTKRKFKVTTSSKHNRPISPNLLNRQFNVAVPDKYWVGDITYIPTNSGWLYLSTVIDLYSRKVIGWSMADNMKSKLINDALTMAIWKRKPKKGLIWHSDRGVQYASKSHRNILKDHGIIQSMSRKGDCWDNAVAESFFHTLKTELTNHYKFKNQEEAKNVIFEYIEVFYNKIRIHSANDYLAPVEFEETQLRELRKTG